MKYGDDACLEKLAPKSTTKTPVVKSAVKASSTTVKGAVKTPSTTVKSTVKTPSTTVKSAVKTPSTTVKSAMKSPGATKSNKKVSITDPVVATPNTASSKVILFKRS